MGYLDGEELVRRVRWLYGHGFVILQVTVDYTETDKISKGDKDKGIIYIAVGDWVSDDANYGSQWPVVVRTKGPKLFNPKDTGTIGYGEMIFTDNVGLDENGGMKEVIIPLDYDNYGGRTRIPTIL